MTTEKVNDLTLVKLDEYFSPELFRLVPAEAFSFPGGITEIPVEINVHSDLAKRLKFNKTKLMTFYGFVRINNTLEKLNGGPFTRSKDNAKLQSVILNDCGSLFTMIINFTDNTNAKFLSVKTSEVENLLNECRHPCVSYNIGF